MNPSTAPLWPSCSASVASADRSDFETSAEDWFGLPPGFLRGQRLTGGSYRSPEYAKAWTFYQMGARRELVSEQPRITWVCYPTEGLSRVEALCRWKGRELRKMGYVSGPYALRRLEEMCREFTAMLAAKGVPV